MKKKLAILGSTGSIGCQTLEAVDQNPDLFGVEVLTANSNADLLIKQAIQYQPNAVVIADKNLYNHVSESLAKFPIKVFAGSESIEQIVSMDSVDMVIVALVGFSGLRPTLSAIDAGKEIGLANKETIVVAGEMVMKNALNKGIKIIPIDSEHSAIFQCLTGEQHSAIDKIILTASGGPFRKSSIEELQTVTPQQALNHPVWKMGGKVTIDSATLMNKGLEVIEAKWLFDVNPNQIEVVIHPQSIIHSMVQYVDGSVKAQLGLPDMRLPIQYALSYPFRLKNNFPKINFADHPNLTFEIPDYNKFKCLSLAFEALKMGGNTPCMLNAADEIAVEEFLKGKISFMKIPEIIEKTMQKCNFISNPALEDFISTHQEAQSVAREFAK